MGMLKGAVKAGVVVKLVDVVRREAAKPENQRKIKEALNKLGKRGGGTPKTS